MKEKLLILILFIATFNLNAQTNLVPNGDMENWDSFDTNPDDWFRFLNGFWEKSSDFQNGASSLQLEIDTERTFIYINTPYIQFTNGKTYVCTFYYKVVSGNITKAEFNLVHTPSVFPENLVTNDFTDLSTTEWKKGEFEFTSSATEKVQAFIYARGDAGSKILIDNTSIVDKSTLSTNEFISESNKIFAYPNPSNDYIEIFGFKENEEYEIYNLIGKIILKGYLQEKQKIDIRNLTGGVYFMKIKNGKTLRIIKK